MEAKLLEVLVCPVCKGPLQYKKAARELCCRPCALAYPLRDGIPVMLVDEARALTAEERQA